VNAAVCSCCACRVDGPGRAGPAAAATQAPVTQAGVAVGMPAVESARRAEKVDYQEMSDEPVFDPLRNARTAAIFMSA
jgi:hypothetical protein